MAVFPPSSVHDLRESKIPGDPHRPVSWQRRLAGPRICRPNGNPPKQKKKLETEMSILRVKESRVWIIELTKSRKK